MWRALMRYLKVAHILPCAVRANCLWAAFIAFSIPSYAAIVTSGNVTPAIPPNGSLPGSLVTVGDTSNGALEINGGSLLTSSRGILGRDANALGLSVVAGANSRWQVAQDLVVGEKGLGRLTVVEGGTV